MKLLYEVEYYRTRTKDEQPDYLYIETDDDIEIEAGPASSITHITTIDTDMGLEPDLIVRRVNNE
jgi:hypothetical protein